MGHKGSKEVSSSGVMVNGRGWESNSSRKGNHSGHEDHHGRINWLLLGQVGEELVDLGPNKGDLISMGGQEQDLICKEYM